MSMMESPDTSVGIVCHYQFENGSSQFAFMDVKGESEASLDHSLSFTTENFVQTLALCKGLILLFGYSGDKPCYHAFNPLTRHTVVIPQTSIIQGSVVRTGLAYDGGEFEVVLVEAGSENSNRLKLHVFSSGSGKWRCHYPTSITAPSLERLEFQEIGTPPLYSNGAIHWEMGGYLLVYQVKGNRCEMYELPDFSEDWSWQSTMSYHRCLCESGGKVYYCYTDFDGFHIWNLLSEEEHLGFFYCCDYKRFPWKLVHSVMRDVFMPNHQGFFDNFFDWEPYKVAPIAYNEQAQIIYLQLPGTVVAYNFNTGTIMGSICNYYYPGQNFNCCSFFSFSSTTSISQKDNTTDEVEESELNLPVAKMENLTL